MKYAAVNEIREGTSFDEVSSLNDKKLEDFILRAERWIHRKTLVRYDNLTDSEVLFDLKRAVILLVDYLWFHDQPEIAEDQLDPIQQERIGSYSYSKKGSNDEGFGNPELDSILESLKVDPKINFFSVSGPSKR